MAYINGTSFGLFHNEILLGHSTSASFNLNVDLPKSTTKQSAGFQEVIAGVKSGTISVSGLIDYSDTFGFEEFSSMVLTRDLNKFVFTQEAFLGMTLTGTGYIVNVEAIAEAENVVSYDLEIQLTDFFSIQDDRSGHRYWNTTDVFWNNANFNWNLA
jgi:hypothetical protein